jgi:hypothetical protein
MNESLADSIPPVILGYGEIDDEAVLGLDEDASTFRYLRQNEANGPISVFGNEHNLVFSLGDLLHVENVPPLAVRFDSPVRALLRMESRHLMPELGKSRSITRL